MVDIVTNRAMNDDYLVLFIFWRRLSQCEIAPIKKNVYYRI